MLKIGEYVPDFEAKVYYNGKFDKIKLSDYKGKWVVLFFYPLDFTFICPTEIKEFWARYKEFTDHNAIIIAASIDSQHSHKAWFERDLPEIKYPIIADTTHAISKLFGILKDDEGVAYRATFIIDQNGILRYSVISDLSVGRSVAETLRVLKALQTGELCPVEWAPGKKTLGKA